MMASFTVESLEEWSTCCRTHCQRNHHLKSRGGGDGDNDVARASEAAFKVDLRGTG